MTNRYIPYGYAIEQGEYTAHPQEAEAVRAIYRHYEAGESYLRIAALMNESAYPKYSGGNAPLRVL